MRHCTIGLIVALVAVMAFPSVTAAQELYPGWLTCPNCQANADKETFRAETANLTFNPRDLSGVWGQNRIQLNRNAPPMTPDGQARYEATRAEETAGGQALSNSKDPMLICDPQGWPRWFTYNYGFEFLHAPERVIQFLEWGHTFRTIWTDGRPLPEDPDPRWLGFSVGRWRGTRSSSSRMVSTSAHGLPRIGRIADLDTRTVMRCGPRSATGAWTTTRSKSR